MEGLTLGARIRNRRKQLGWTLDRLAAESGRTKSFLSDLERDKRRPGADTAMAIARAIGVSIDALVGGNGAVDVLPSVFQSCPHALATVALDRNLSFRDVSTLLRLRAVLAAHHGQQLPEAYLVDWVRLWEAVAPFLS